VRVGLIQALAHRLGPWAGTACAAIPMECPGPVDTASMSQIETQVSVL
jgi:hypothetical protein